MLRILERVRRRWLHRALRICSPFLVCLLAQVVISQKVVHSHGYYCFDVQNGQKSFSLGFPEKYEAESWLEMLLEVAGKKISIYTSMRWLE